MIERKKCMSPRYWGGLHSPPSHEDIFSFGPSEVSLTFVSYPRLPTLDPRFRHFSLRRHFWGLTPKIRALKELSISCSGVSAVQVILDDSQVAITCGQRGDTTFLESVHIRV